MERLHKVWIAHCWSSSNPSLRNAIVSSRPIVTCCPEHLLVHMLRQMQKVHCSCCPVSLLPPSRNLHVNGNGSVPLSGSSLQDWQTLVTFQPSLTLRVSSFQSTSHSVCLSLSKHQMTFSISVPCSLSATSKAGREPTMWQNPTTDIIPLR